MGIHYFIDGYNVIRSSRWLSLGTLDAQRDNLLQYIVDQNYTRSPVNKVTVVFDGKPGRNTPAPRRGIRVCFSFEKDADSIIKRDVDALSNSRNAVVVTNDKAIRFWVQGAKAKVISCAAFLAAPTPPPFGTKKTILPSSLAQNITRELETIWLLPKRKKK